MIEDDPDTSKTKRRRIAYYGGSFDPIHNGHMAIANAVIRQFSLDQCVLIPAFHAPHKQRLRPTSAYDRYAMLCIATQDSARVSVSRMEIERPERPYSVETLSRLAERHPDDDIFFVMGADSWLEITQWREWERVLRLTNHIVVTRPGSDIGTSHVGEATRKRIVDLRTTSSNALKLDSSGESGSQIFFTDVVNVAISATAIRKKFRDGDHGWRSDVPQEVAKYIEKYQIYK